MNIKNVISYKIHAQKNDTTTIIPSCDRDEYIDLLKFWGILLMIIGHSEFRFWYDGFPMKFAYSFHMPLFFIVSGFLYRPRKIKETIFKLSQKTLYPYFIFGTVCFFLIVNGGGNEVEGYLKTLLFGNGDIWERPLLSNQNHIGVLWFLLAYFSSRIMFDFIITYTKSGFIIASIFLSYISYKISFFTALPFNILPAGVSLVFMAIGYYFRLHGANLMLVMSFVLIWIYDILYEDFNIQSCYFTNYIFNIIGAIGGTLFCYYLIIFLSKYIRLHTFAVYGRNSMYVLCWHAVLAELLPSTLMTGKWLSLIYVILPFFFTHATIKSEKLQKLFEFPLNKRRKW